MSARSHRRMWPAIFVMGVLAATPALDATPADLEARFGYVERLLSESSAARKIEQSTKPEAIALKAEAEASLESAKAHSAAGDDEAARAELAEAVRLLTEAARAANGHPPVTSKQSSDYGLRRDSVEALATAHDRVAREKGQAELNARLQERVSRELAESDALLASGDATHAREQLDATYEAVKHSLENLRDGDTLIRALNFETPEDEYRYELDRNDTHRMLVDVLFAEKMQASPMRTTADGFREQAAELRLQAESAAAKKEFVDAIALLEESTRELIRAIRSAGVYIPG